MAFLNVIKRRKTRCDKVEDELYREHILDLYQHPRNFGTIKQPTHHCAASNPLCGDEILIMVDAKDDTIKDIKFKGSGCAISIAAASLLTEKVKGLTIAQARKLDQKDMFEMLAIRVGPARYKCALLAWRTLQDALANQEGNAGAHSAQHDKNTQ